MYTSKKTVQVPFLHPTPPTGHIIATQKMTTTMMVKKTMARGRRQRSVQRSCTVSSGTSVVPPRHLGGHHPCSVRESGTLAGDATTGSDNNDNDNYKGGDDEEEDGL